MRLDGALPTPLRRRFDPQTLTLEAIEPDAGLGIYVADATWPAWARDILEKSQELAQEYKNRAAVGIPMGG